MNDVRVKDRVILGEMGSSIQKEHEVDFWDEEGSECWLPGYF